MTFYYKNKLYNNEIVSEALNTAVFPKYNYSVKDYNDSLVNDYMPCIKIITSNKIVIQNGILTVGEDSLPLYDMLMGDVVQFLNSLDSVQASIIDTSSIASTSDVLANVPAIMLSNCSNFKTSIIDGDISPLSLTSIDHNKTILPVTDFEISKIFIYNSEQKKEVGYTTTDKNLYFDTSLETKVYITESCNTFFLYFDLKIKQLSEGYLINYGLLNSDIISYVPSISFPQALNGTLSFYTYTFPISVRVKIDSGIMLGDSWIVSATSYGNNLGTVTLTDLNNGYIETTFPAVQGETIEVKARFYNASMSTQEGTNTLVIEGAVGVISCAGATSGVSFFDSAEDVQSQSLTFYISVNGIVTELVANGTGVGNSNNDDGTWIPGSDVWADDILTQYLYNANIPNLSIIGDVWYGILLQNTSTTEPLRLSIYTQAPDTWGIVDLTSPEIGLPFKVSGFNTPNPTLNMDLGAGKYGFEVCLGPNQYICTTGEYLLPTAAAMIDGNYTFTYSINNGTKRTIQIFDGTIGDLRNAINADYISWSGDTRVLIAPQAYFDSDYYFSFEVDDFDTLIVSGVGGNSNVIEGNIQPGTLLLSLHPTLISDIPVGYTDWYSTTETPDGEILPVINIQGCGYYVAE